MSDRTTLLTMTSRVLSAISSSKADQAGWLRDFIWDMSGWTVLWQKKYLD